MTDIDLKALRELANRWDFEVRNDYVLALIDRLEAYEAKRCGTCDLWRLCGDIGVCTRHPDAFTEATDGCWRHKPKEASGE